MGLPNFEASIFSISKKKGLYFPVLSRNVHAVQELPTTVHRPTMSLLPGKAAVSATRRCRRRSLGSWSQACPVVTPFSVVRCRIHGGAGPSRLLICTPRRHRKIKGTPLELVAILSSRITAFHESEGRWNGLWNVTVRIRSSFHSTGEKRKEKMGPGTMLASQRTQMGNSSVKTVSGTSAVQGGASRHVTRKPRASVR